MIEIVYPENHQASNVKSKNTEKSSESPKSPGPFHDFDGLDDSMLPVNQTRSHKAYKGLIRIFVPLTL